MRACLALCVAAALVGAVRPECGACIQGACYRRHDLPGLSEYNLYEIDRDKNILYFRHSSDVGTVRQCSLDTLQCNTTTYAWNIKQLTVNQRTGDTYGVIIENSKNVLYKLDLVNTRKELLVPSKVYYITFGDKIYYSTSGNGIYTFEDGQCQLVAGTEEYYPYNFIVDKNYDIYFSTYVSNKYIIMRLSKGIVDPTVHWEDEYLMTVDRDGNAVFFHQQSHAVYKATDGQLVEVGVINDPISYNIWYGTSLFDRVNHLVYRDDSDTYNYNRSYFHLKRDTDVNCTYSISQDKAIITETVVSTTPYTIETTTSSTRDGDTEGNEDMSPSTPAESAASTPGESGGQPLRNTRTLS